MFAVPGWSISSAGPVRGKELEKAPTSDVDETDVKSLNSKKRKRTGGGVPDAELGTLWDKHFGVDGKTEKIGGKKKKTTGRDHKQQDGGGVEKNGVRAEIGLKTDKAEGIVVGGEEGVKGAQRRSALVVNPEMKDARSMKVKQKKKRDDVNRAAHGQANTNGKVSRATEHSKPQPGAPAQPPPSQSSFTPLQKSMRAKLVSARFRHLNETLYTTPSTKALSMFSESPELFAEYHAGFSQQVREAWPENPVDIYINTVKTRARITVRPSGRDGKGNTTSGPADPKNIPLPRRPHGTCTFADLGCGDAQLARGLQSSMKSLNLRFHNYDLHAANTLITKADISNVPLKDGEVDVAVFCLSLMGTNWISFVEEAWRILRGDGRGEVWVAEVKSRFGRGSSSKATEEDSSGKKNKKKKPKKTNRDTEDEFGGDQEIFAEVDVPSDQQAAKDKETDISAFIQVFQRRGFALKTDSVNKNNKMFVSMVFTKSGIPTAGKWKGMKWVGTRYERVGAGNFQTDGKKRFLDEGEKDERDVGDEGKVLKPCVYKVR